jgi:heme exporter protein B
VEARNRELLGLTVVFAVLVPLLFRLAFDAGASAAAGAPVLWVTLLVVTVGGIGRSFHIEADRGMLDALLASPLSRAQLFTAKVFSGFFVTSVAGLIGLATTASLVDSTVLARPELALAVVIVGAAGLATLATVVSAITVRSRARGLLLPVVAFPLGLPLVVMGVQATQAASLPLGQGALPAFGSLLLSMVAYLAVLLGVGVFCADRALEG